MHGGEYQLALIIINLLISLSNALKALTNMGMPALP
jgi:hypothetical protein